MSMLPKYLENYDALKELIEWKGDHADRDWHIGTAPDSKFVKCRLEWNSGVMRIGTIYKMSYTIQECVWKALEEFKKYDKEKKCSS